MAQKLGKRVIRGSPEFNEAISKRMIKKWKTPGYREKRSKAVKKMWENPEYRAKVVQGNKIAWKRSREEYLTWTQEMRDAQRKTQSERMKKLWTIPGYRDKLSNAIHLAMPRGEKHHNWNGGKSNHPYPLEFNEGLKNAIKTRDGFVCSLCWSGSSLHVHHINYDKDDLREKNLITLCATCHAKTLYDREHWESILSSYLLYGIGLLGSLLTTCP